MEEANAANVRLKSLLQKKDSAKLTSAPRGATGAGVAGAVGSGEGKEEDVGVGLEQWMQGELRFCVEVSCAV